MSDYQQTVRTVLKIDAINGADSLRNWKNEDGERFGSMFQHNGLSFKQRDLCKRGIRSCSSVVGLSSGTTSSLYQHMIQPQGIHSPYLRLSRLAGRVFWPIPDLAYPPGHLYFGLHDTDNPWM